MFGQRLELLLTEKGIQQSVLAEHLNMADSTISQWKTGKRSPDIESLKNIAKFFNCTIDYLVGFSDQRRPIEQTKNENEDEFDFVLAANKEGEYGREPSPELKSIIKSVLKEELLKMRKNETTNR